MNSLNRIISLLIFLGVLASFTACSEKKPPTDAAIKGNSVVSALEDLSRQFSRKNLAGFMNLISNDFEQRQKLASSLQTVFEKNDAVRTTIQFTKMLIMIDHRGAPRADFNWDSEWQAPGGSVLKNSGRAAFLFDAKDTKLISIEGKNPFLPQPIESHGKQ